jgi:hypothetical protein
MRALVVYESMWGNTRQVAEAIGKGLGDARVLEVQGATAAELGDVELLVVGGPTHAFSMSRPATRRDAVERGAPAAGESRGVREWLDGLPAVLPMPVATFDTKVTSVRNLPGSAAKGAARMVHRHHHGTVVDRRSFYVEDTGGPLAPGELERAARWGADLAATVAARR